MNQGNIQNKEHNLEELSALRILISIYIEQIFIERSIVVVEFVRELFVNDVRREKKK